MNEFSQYSWTGIIDYIKNQKLILDKEREEWNVERNNFLCIIQEKDSMIRALQNEKKELIKKVVGFENSFDKDSEKTHKAHHRIHSDFLNSVRGQQGRVDELVKKSPLHKSSQSYGDYAEDWNEGNVLPGINLYQDYKPLTKKYWSPKLSLKSHLDSVRSVRFLSPEVLSSAGEDCLIKLWDCSLLVQDSDIIEPFLTLRGHSGAILSLTSGQDILFTSDSEGFIRSWSIPSISDIDPDAASVNYCLTKWKGHSDSIWSVRFNERDNALITCSADTTVKLWKIPVEYRSGSPVCKTFTYPGLHNNPTVCDWVTSNMSYVSVGYLSFIAIYNTETSGFSKIPFVNDTHLPSHQVNCIFNTSGTNVTITGHEDKRIRFFDLSSNKCIKDMVGHTDSVTGVSVDKSGFYMLSTGHDGSLRSWDLRNFHCLHEITLNRKKYDESIFGLDMHPTLDLVAIAGSDSVIKVLESKLM